MANLLLTHAIDAFTPIATYVAIAVVACAIIANVVIFFAKKELFSKFLKISTLSLVAFLLILGLSCLIMEILKCYSPSELEENYLDGQMLATHVLIPISALTVLILACGCVFAILNNKFAKPNDGDDVNAKKRKMLGIVLGAVLTVAVIACAVFIAIYYDAKFSADGYYNSDTASVNQPVLYISAAILIIAIISAGFLLNNNDKPFDTKCLSLAGITVAMSFGLSFIKLFQLPQGGSVTLFSLLPIMIFSFIYGTKKGVFVCMLYGVLQAIQDPWIIHPAQFLLDYPVAFSAIGLTGAFSKIKKLETLPQVQFLLGGVLAGLIRYVSHVLSGVFAFSAYAAGAHPLVYSLAYNSFVFVDLAIVVAIGFIAFSSKALLREIKKFA